MKKFLKFAVPLVVFSLLAIPAFTQDEISQSTGIIGNGRLLGAKTYDGQATVGVLGIDSSGNTVVKAMSGKAVSLAASTTPAADNTYDVGSSALGYRTGYFDTSVITPLVSHATSLALGIAGTAEATLTDDTLTFSGAAPAIVGGATSLTVGSAGTTIIKAANDAQRLFTFSGASDTALLMTFGDAGVTATQAFNITASTADADDDSTLRIMGGGAQGDSRGGWCRLLGNEVASTGGSIEFFVGNVATADFKIALENASSDFIVSDTTSGNLFSILNAGSALLVAGDYRIAGAGTLSLQEATAGAACMGTATANGTTVVPVATTCATTGSRVFISRSSAVAGAVTEPGCWATNIINGTSFDLDCNDASEDSTFNWMIIHEAP